MSISLRREYSPLSPAQGWLLAAVCLLALPVLSSGPLFAQALDQPVKQAEEPATAKTHPNNPELWNVDAMVEDAIQQIARRYNLNKAQEEYTRLLLTQRVKAFLKIYEDDVRALLKETIDFRTGLKPLTPEAIMDWAERAMPVYEAARQAILEGNSEWRQILTEEQIKTHDLDLQQMETQFTSVSTLLDKTRKGEDTGRWMGYARTGDQGKNTGLVSTNPVIKVIRHTEDNWQAYVEQFIRVYQLDEKQQNSVRAGIYNETFQQAKQHREKNKGQFEKLEAELQIVEKDPKLADRRADLLLQKAKLEQPIRARFIAMAKRMDGQLKEEQRGAADPVEVKALERMHEELSGEREITRVPGTGPKLPATQPATSGPAATQPAVTEKAPAAREPASQPSAKPAEEPKPAETGKGPPPAISKPEDKPKIPDPPKSESDQPPRPDSDS